MPDTELRRGRGRPVGGGVSPEESKEAFLDAAERSFTTRGHRASTMEMIARDAGYSRGSIYRHFPTRESLVQALIWRTTHRHGTRILERFPEGIGPVSLLVETMVVVATELIHDPLLKTISDQTDERTVAHTLATDTGLAQMVEAIISESSASREPERFRRDVHPRDLAQFVISTNISLLLGIVPGTDDPDTARRYIDAFVVPALVAHPPRACTVCADELSHEEF